MKCLCGYEYEEITGKDGFIEIKKGDKDFKLVRIARDCYPIEYLLIYICPKCGTLKTELI